MIGTVGGGRCASGQPGAAAQRRTASKHAMIPFDPAGVPTEWPQLSRAMGWDSKFQQDQAVDEAAVNIRHCAAGLIR